MNLVITLTSAGVDTGPFNLYSNVDLFANAFETNVSKADLLAGYPSNLVPDGTTEVRVKSVNALCNNDGSGGTDPLEYYFEPQIGSYVVDFLESGNFVYVYGYFDGYYNGSYTVPGNLIVKLQEDRSVETFFDVLEGFNFGIVYIGATIYQQLDGKIILSGFYTSFNGVTENRIIRLNTDGTKDVTFNSGVGFNDYTTKISADSAGNIFVTGRYSAYDGITAYRIIKLLPDGSHDSSFITAGFDNVTIDILHNPDDSMYITGYYNNYNGEWSPRMVKINSNGSRDPSFVVGSGFNTLFGVSRTTSLARIQGEDNFWAAGFWTEFNGTAYPHIVKFTPLGVAVGTGEFDPGTGFDGDVGILKVIWTNKLFVGGGSFGDYGPFANYNGTATLGSYVILNADGTILKTWTTEYINLYVLGFKVFGQPAAGGENQLIYTYTP